MRRLVTGLLLLSAVSVLAPRGAMAGAGRLAGTTQPTIRDATGAQVGTYLGMNNLSLVLGGIVHTYGQVHPLVRLTHGSLAFGALVVSEQLLGTWHGLNLFFTEPDCQGVAFQQVGLINLQPAITPTMTPVLAPTFASPGDPGRGLWAADLTQTPITRDAQSVRDLVHPNCINTTSSDVPDTIPFIEVTPTFTPPFRLIIE
jgi:hypothetical protein